jgi:hypothetical protein
LNCKDVEYIAVGDIIDLKLDRIVSPFCSGQNGLGSIYVNVDVSCNEAQTYAWVNTANPTVVISTSQDLINVPPAEYELTVTYGPCTETLVYDLGITHIVDGDTVWDSGSSTDGVITINGSLTTTSQNLIFGDDIAVIASPTNTTWTVENSNLVFAGPLEIELRAASGSGVINSTLVGHNTVFTAGCDSYWDGIQVMAALILNDLDETRSSATLQSCHINYAYDGVRNHRENMNNAPVNTIATDNLGTGQIHSTSVGGNLLLTNCFFHNNHRDVHITGGTNSNSYSDYHPLIEDCLSLLDDSNLGDVSERVLIEGSRGARIYRSNFLNEDLSLLNAQELICIRASENLYTAVSLNGAKFRLVDDTPVEEGVGRARISGFTRGVSSKNIGSFFTLEDIYIDGMQFECYRGVFTERPHNLKVYRNTFLDIPVGYPFDPGAPANDPTRIVLSNNSNETPFETGGVQNPQASYGCYAIMSMTSMDIQENIFDHDNPDVDMRYGLICTNTGGNSTSVRLNDFRRNDFACAFQGNNRNNATLEATSIGLKFSCNHFAANSNGTSILDMQNKKDVIIVPMGLSNQGVQTWQNGGTANMTANNKWSQSSDATIDDIHENISGVTHNYRESVPTDIPQEYTGVVLQGSTQTNDCSSDIGPPVLASEGGGEFMTMRQSVEVDLELKKMEYLEIVDDGDTEGLTEEVIYTTYSEALELYYELLSKSPALSDEVMIEAIKKEYDLPAPLLTQILTANPSSAKSERVQKELDQRMLPLDEWQKQQIMAGLEIVSQKESLEEEMGALLTERSEAVNLQIEAIKCNDMILDKVQAVVEVLDPINYFSDRQLFIQLLKEMGMTVEAIESLENIPLDFKVDGSLLLEINQLISVWETESLLKGMEAPALSDSQQEMLKEIFFTSNSWASGEALSVLRLYSDFTYIEPILEDGVPGNRALGIECDMDHMEYLIYPNPTANWCVFERIDASEVFDLCLVDGNGRIIRHETMTIGQKQLLIETGLLTSGSYLIQVKDIHKSIRWQSTLIKL